MRIYFSASISGGRRFLPACTRMVAFLKSLGHMVLTEHIVAPDVLKGEMLMTARQIYERDVAWIASCEAMVAEVSNPSLGVGYEICYALDCGKPVLCLFEQGIFVSRMITGNCRPGMTIAGYMDDDEWQRQISSFLQ